LLFYKSYDKWFPKAEEIRKITSGKVKPFLLKGKRECRNDMRKCLLNFYTYLEGGGLWKGILSLLQKIKQIEICISSLSVFSFCNGTGS